MKSFTRSSTFMALALAAMVATATSAHATGISISPNGGNSYLVTNVSPYNLTGWTNNYSAGVSGYNFALNTATSAVTPTYPQAGLVMDGATTNNGASVLALDADYEQGAVSTTLSTLAAGSTVTLTFDFAGDQQLEGSDGCGFCTGNFDALLNVTLGGAGATNLIAADVTTGDLDAAKGASQDTTTSCANENNHTPCLVSQEFSGWESESLTFTVNNSSTNNVLSFLASDPNSVAQDPAFALIDNLSYTVTPPTTVVPEPNSLLLLSTGLLGLGGYVRMRSKSGAATKA